MPQQVLIAVSIAFVLAAAGLLMGASAGVALTSGILGAAIAVGIVLLPAGQQSGRL